MVGQTLARVFVPDGRTGGLELNYSSMSAVGVTIVIVIVVLLSNSIEPAAADIASLVRATVVLARPARRPHGRAVAFTVTGRVPWA
jgi:hypothetical protein